MKGIIALIVLLGIGFFFWSVFLGGETLRDPGRPLAIAFGAPRGDVMQMHLGVSPMIPRADPPGTARGRVLWKEWTAEHFQLRDDSGKVVPLRRMVTSGLLLGKKLGGAPEFVLWAELKKGGKYTFDFVPVAAKSKRYRHSFTVPSEPREVGRRTFNPVPDEG